MNVMRYESKYMWNDWYTIFIVCFVLKPWWTEHTFSERKVQRYSITYTANVLPKDRHFVVLLNPSRVLKWRDSVLPSFWISLFFLFVQVKKLISGHWTHFPCWLLFIFSSLPSVIAVLLSPGRTGGFIRVSSFYP